MGKSYLPSPPFHSNRSIMSTSSPSSAASASSYHISVDSPPSPNERARRVTVASSSPASSFSSSSPFPSPSPSHPPPASFSHPHTSKGISLNSPSSSSSYKHVKIKSTILPSNTTLSSSSSTSSSFSSVPRLSTCLIATPQQQSFSNESIQKLNKIKENSINNQPSQPSVHVSPKTSKVPPSSSSPSPSSPSLPSSSSPFRASVFPFDICTLLSNCIDLSTSHLTSMRELYHVVRVLHRLHSVSSSFPPVPFKSLESPPFNTSADKDFLLFTNIYHLLHDLHVLLRALHVSRTHIISSFRASSYVHQLQWARRELQECIQPIRQCYETEESLSLSLSPLSLVPSSPSLSLYGEGVSEATLSLWVHTFGPSCRRVEWVEFSEMVQFLYGRQMSGTMEYLKQLISRNETVSLLKYIKLTRDQSLRSCLLEITSSLSYGNYLPLLQELNVLVCTCLSSYEGKNEPNELIKQSQQHRNKEEMKESIHLLSTLLEQLIDLLQFHVQDSLIARLRGEMINRFNLIRGEKDPLQQETMLLFYLSYLQTTDYMFSSAVFPEEMKGTLGKLILPAIERGSVLFNKREYEACAEEWETLIRGILDKYSHTHTLICSLETCAGEIHPLFDPLARALLTCGTIECEPLTSLHHQQRAMVYRRALDFYYYNKLLK